MKMVPFCNEHRQYQSLDGTGQNGVLGRTFGVVRRTKDPVIQYLPNLTKHTLQTPPNLKGWDGIWRKGIF